MTRRRTLATASTIAAALALALSLSPGNEARGSGEHTLSTFFEYRTHPDFPLEEFAAGRLGVLQPGFRREYLAVAWRYLHGGKLDAAERAASVDVMRQRLRLPSEALAKRRTAEGRVAAWVRARGLVRGARAPGEIRPYKESSQWVEYQNCLPDAFETAARTLRERVARLGAESSEVRGWLAAQDQVFAACGSIEGAPDAAARAAVPEELPAEASPLARADRDYQIAAAHFYRSHFEEAVQRFHRIAHQADSPWAPLGNYLAARALIRKATLAPDLDRTALVDAERELGGIVAAAPDEAARARAERLLSHVAVTLHPEEQVRALAHRIDRGSRDLRNDLTDYLWLLARTRSVESPAGEAGHGEAPLLELPRLRAEDEMSDWLLFLSPPRSDGEEPPAASEVDLEHALTRFRATRSLPWLLAVLMKVPAAHPAVRELLDAAAAVPEASPARESLLYHALRIEIDSGRPELVAAAQKRLDALLPPLRAARPGTALNRFLAMRLRTAGSIDEVVELSQRFVLGTGIEQDEREVPEEIAASGKKPPPPAVRLDDDGAALLRTRLPLSLLLKVLENPRLAEGLRHELARALFVRAVMLDDVATAQKLLPAAQALVIEAPAWREGLAAFAAAAGDEQKLFAARFMILKLPGLRPWVDAGVGREAPLAHQDEFRDNWWCAPLGDGVPRSRPGDPEAPATPPLTFLTEGERKAAEAEVASLARFGAGANLLAATILEHARTHPGDPRLPEALFLVNRATHFGCTDDKTSGWSKQAYLVLHKSWPRNSWTRRVKYWW